MKDLKDQIAITEHIVVNLPPLKHSIKFKKETPIKITILEEIPDINIIEESKPISLDEITINNLKVTEYTEEDLVSIIEENSDDLISQITIITDKAKDIEIKIIEEKTYAIPQYNELKNVYSQLEEEYSNLQKILNSIEDKNSPLYRIIKEKLVQLKQLLNDLKVEIDKIEKIIQDIEEEGEIIIEEDDKQEETTIKIDIKGDIDTSKISTDEVLKLINAGENINREIVRIREKTNEQPTVVISQLAIDKIKAYGKTSNLEVGGLIYGKYDPEKNEIIVYDFSSVKGESQTANFTFNPGSWEEALVKQDNFNNMTNQNIEMLGWVHTHPGYGGFLSLGHDIPICRGHFNMSHQLSIVYDPINDELAIWFNDKSGPNLIISPVNQIEVIGEDIDVKAIQTNMAKWQDNNKQKEYRTNVSSSTKDIKPINLDMKDL